MTIRTKRVYDPAEEGDGLRILVDRTWPRGMTKEVLALDSWERGLAPAKELCVSLKEGGVDWESFAGTYRAGLSHSDIAQRLMGRLRAEEPRTVTILYASASRERNHALVLAEFLARELGCPAE